MDRLACVEIPGLPLQLLKQAHPEWSGVPCALVAELKPQFPLRWIDPAARARGILAGMRYAAALALSADLRAAPGPTADVARAVDDVAQRLSRFTPHVEAARDNPGIFWLDAGGLAG